MISIKKGDQFKAAYSNKTYKVVGKWGGNLVLAPVEKDNDECLIYSAEEIEEMVDRRKWAHIGRCGA